MRRKPNELRITISQRLLKVRLSIIFIHFADASHQKPQTLLHNRFMLCLLLCILSIRYIKHISQIPKLLFQQCGGTWCIEQVFVLSLYFLPFCVFIIHPQCVLWMEAEWCGSERKRERNKAFGRWVMLKLNSLTGVQRGGWEWRADSILESTVAMNISFQGPWLTWSSAFKASHL